MPDYTLQLPGSEIDQRLAKVSQLETEKQDKLVSGSNIKTINGQSVLGSGNLQIQTGETDVVKYTDQTLTEEQKAQARANIAAASAAELGQIVTELTGIEADIDSLEAAVAAIDNDDYVTATTLPTASASTMGHIYLIGPDANNNYDRYFTQESGGAYSWISLGSTQINLSTYATKAEVTQLEHEVDGAPEVDIDPTAVDSMNCFVTTANQWQVNNTNSVGKLLEVTPGRKIKIVASSTYETPFAFVKGTTPVASASVEYATGETRRQITRGGSVTVEVPSDAVYLWFGTKSYSNVLTPQAIKVIADGGLSGRIDDAEAEIGRNVAKFDNGGIGWTKILGDLGIKLGEKVHIKLSSDTVLTRCILSYNGNGNRIKDVSNISTLDFETTAPADITSIYIFTQSATVANITLVVESGLAYEIDENRKGINELGNKLSDIGYYRNYSQVSTLARIILQDLKIKSGEKIIINVKTDTAVSRLIVATASNLSGKIIDYDSDAKDSFSVEYTAVSDISTLYIYSTTETNAFLELFSRYAYDVQKELGGSADIEELENEVSKINEDIYTDVPVWELVASPQVTAQGFINISTGDVAAYASYNYVADYINVEGADFVKLVDAGNTSSSAGYVFYTKNGDTYDPILPGGNQTHGIVIPVPVGATHIRFSTALTYTSPKIYKNAFVEQLTISRLRGKKIVCFGDSITEFTDEWGKSYADHIADISGATVINVGIGGSYYRERTTPELNPSSTQVAKAALDVVNMVKAAMDEDFTYQVNAANYLANEGDDNTAIITRLSQIDWDTVDIVTFFAGTNDWNNSVKRGVSGDTDPQTTLGAINTIIQEILTNYPAIKIYFFTPVVRWLNYSGGTGDPADFGDNFVRGDMTLRQFCKFISDEILLNHIPVYDSYNLMGWNMYNFSNYFVESDGTHPYKGFKYIAEKFVAFLEANI